MGAGDEVAQHHDEQYQPERVANVPVMGLLAAGGTSRGVHDVEVDELRSEEAQPMAVGDEAFVAVAEHDSLRYMVRSKP